jgi:hypothetical protein
MSGGHGVATLRVMANVRRVQPTVFDGADAAALAS